MWSELANVSEDSSALPGKSGFVRQRKDLSDGVSFIHSQTVGELHTAPACQRGVTTWDQAGVTGHSSLLFAAGVGLPL